MTQIEKCCVCGTENQRTYCSEEVGLVEDHYYCNNCGYFRAMAFCSPFEGIDTIIGSKQDRERKECLSARFKEKIDKLHLQINPPGMEYL